MPIEFHRDGPWDVPEGWVWAQLAAVSRETGRTDPARQYAWRVYLYRFDVPLMTAE